MTKRGAFVAALTVAVSVLLSSCALDIPRDPNGTLDRVRGGILRVAVSHNPPFTDALGEGDPTGTEVEIVRAFAEKLDAAVEFTLGGEESLVEDMHLGKHDLLIGGLTDKSPWFDKVALTGPYLTVDDPEGTERNIVMAVPLGENDLLFELEDFLQRSKATG